MQTPVLLQWQLQPSSPGQGFSSFPRALGAAGLAIQGSSFVCPVGESIPDSKQELSGGKSPVQGKV